MTCNIWLLAGGAIPIQSLSLSLSLFLISSWNKLRLSFIHLCSHESVCVDWQSAANWPDSAPSAFLLAWVGCQVARSNSGSRVSLSLSFFLPMKILTMFHSASLRVCFGFNIPFITRFHTQSSTANCQLALPGPVDGTLRPANEKHVTLTSARP